ncbi:MAG: hypothetical protein INR68_08230 [Methylobacterium mesophilicum]|nr:hypothetical protein [Methylobacterium mesophilicum]
MEYSPFASMPAARGFAASAPAIGNLAAIIERTAEALDEETQGIRTDVRYDLKASNARKSRCLYELSKAAKGMAEADILAQHGPALKLLREKLNRNEATIRAHLSAVGEVAALLQDVIERSQSDGTYSAGGF